MAKATTIKDALKKLEETKGVSAAEMEKVDWRALGSYESSLSLLYVSITSGEGHYMCIGRAVWADPANREDGCLFIHT